MEKNKEERKQSHSIRFKESSGGETLNKDMVTPLTFIPKPTANLLNYPHAILVQLPKTQKQELEQGPNPET